MTDDDVSESKPRIGEGQLVMPFYLILDMSGSMQNDVSSLREVAERLISELRLEPSAGDTALISVIGFGSNARTYLPLTRLDDITLLPSFELMGGTSYVAAWNAYDTAVRADYATIKAANGMMHRPCVFFLTDGEPDGDERSASSSNPDVSRFRQWFLDRQGPQSLKYWPYVLAYGFRNASRGVLEEICYPNFGEKRGQWFLAGGKDVPTILEDIKNLLFQTIVQTTLTASSANPEIRPASPKAGSSIETGVVDQAF